MFIRSIYTYLPDHSLTIEEAIRAYSNEVHDLETGTVQALNEHYTEQLKLRSVALAEEVTDEEMVTFCVQEFFESSGVEPSEIDGIIFVQEESNYQTKNLGHLIQYQSKMKNAFVFNLTGNHCVNFEMGLKVAKGLILEQSDVNKILIVAVQKIVENRKRLVGKHAILGDGAGVTFVDRSEGQLEYIASSTSASGKVAANNKKVDENYMVHYRKLSQSLKETLSKSGISPDELHKVFIPETNAAIFSAVLEQFGISKNVLVPSDLSESQGHLTSIDLMINLERFVLNRNIEKDRYFLSMGFGIGGNYQTLILKTR